MVGAALSFSASNNRITTAGYAYDAAGNLTSDVAHTYGFDAENKIKTVDGVSDIYRYDGDGNQVRKNIGAGDKLRMVCSGGHFRNQQLAISTRSPSRLTLPIRVGTVIVFRQWVKR